MFSHRFLLTPLAIAAATLCAAAVHAQQTPVGGPPVTQVAALSPVVVTATRSNLRVDDLVADVTVITRDELQQQSGHTLAELLGSQPGLQSAASGGTGQTANVYVRGMEATQTLLLVDGMRLGSATLGAPSWANLPLADIDHVEIVRGPLASLYGSDAAGGVVQVFTREPRNGSAMNAAIGAGRYGQAEASAGWRGGEGPWSASLQFSHDQANGFSATNAKNTFSYNPDKDGYERNAGSAQVGLKLGGDWRANARLFNVENTTDYDDGPGGTAKYRARNQVFGTDLGGTVVGGWKTKIGFARSTDGYDVLQAASPFSELGKIATVQRQYSWENTVDTPLGTALVLGEHLAQNVDKPNITYTVNERRVNALGLGLAGGAGAHLWQLSGRLDHNSQYGRQKTGSAAYGWRFLPGWTLGGQFGTAFVAPSFNDLYWPADGSGSFGNPNLRPSRSRSAEVSVGFKRDEVEAKVTVYRTRVSDLIQWVEVAPNTFQYTPMNVSRAAIDGVTLQGQVPFAGWLWKAAFDYTDARDEDSGRQLARRSPRVARVAADRQQGDWRYGTSLTGRGSYYSNPVNTERLSGYALLDLYAQWTFQRDWTVAARLNNALDRQYETVYGYNQPGRALMVTLRYQGS